MMMHWLFLIGSVVYTVLTGYIIKLTGDGLYVVPALLLCHACIMLFIPSEGDASALLQGVK